MRKIIKAYSSAPGIDLTEFFRRIVFCFLTGNSDMHLKNFSLIETSPGNRVFSLAPAYDLLPVNLVLIEDKDETALTLNGKRRGLKRKDFLDFAKSIGIKEKPSSVIIQDVLSRKETLLKMIEESLLAPPLKENYINLVEERASRLTA